MSIDTIDDLHAAEDRIAELYDALHSLVRADEWRRRGVEPGQASAYAMSVAGAMQRARELVGPEPVVAWCRPSCGWASDGECLDGEDDCGCLCGHGEGEPA